MPAPIRPPMRECVDEEGSPNFQVMMFQTVAVRSPIRSTSRVCSSEGRIRRPEMVKATALPPRIAPSNDTPATNIIPDFGEAERDAMKVAAMELAS
jgi:hypothetical protein